LQGTRIFGTETADEADVKGRKPDGKKPKPKAGKEKKI
jgi:hypothetical protein